MAALDLVAESGIVKSRGEAKRMFSGGGLYLNNERLSDPTEAITLARAIDTEILVLRKGKKDYLLVKLT